MNDYKILDLGCGKSKERGAIGVDNVKLPEVDLVHDLTKFPYPFEDNSIDRIYCKHTLEHFEPDMRNKVINEINRILKLGGEVVIKVPHAFTVAAKTDPTHKSQYCFRTIMYFTKDHDFSYYKEVNNNFSLQLIWANISIFGLSNNSNFLNRSLNSAFTRVFNRIFDYKSIVPDLVVKTIPFHSVEILWILKKG